VKGDEDEEEDDVEELSEPLVVPNAAAVAAAPNLENHPSTCLLSPKARR
jgi:hypothetical protein